MDFFKRFSIFWLIVIPLMIPGVLVSAWRLVFRHIAEQRNVIIETVVDFEEIRKLAREEGWSLKELFDTLKKNGASSVAISEDTFATLEAEGKITVMNSGEIRKLSLEETYELEPPAGTSTLGSLWVHSENTALLDRIEQTLSWKIPIDRLRRVHRNLLLVNKSSQGFRERVGLGFSTEYFQMAEDAGLGLVVRVYNYPGLSVDAAAKIIKSLPPPASVSALLFAEEEMLGARGELNKIVGLFKERSYRIGWVEFNLQNGIETYLNGLAATRPFVRVHSIGRKELDLVYNVPRAVARWVRAVKDRSLKMLYIRCFFQDDKKFIENLANFNIDYLARIVKELSESGFRVANNQVERLHEPRHLVGPMTIFEKLAAGISLLLGPLILLRTTFWPSIGPNFCLGTVALFSVFCFAAPADQFTALAGLLGAVSYSCLGVVLAMRRLEENGAAGFWKNVPGFALRMVLPSIFGGLLIAGLYSEIEYLLKFDQFRGIKLAFILPLLITGIWSLRSYGRGIFGLLHRPLTPVVGILLAAAAGSVLLYVLRSGNVTFLKPSEAEDTFRTFLENILVARPRNKEFLVGYPAGLLFIFFYLRRNFAILPLLAVFMQMGQVSALNSLCHFHTPLLLSLLRIFNGLWLGLVIGVAVVFAAAVLQLLLRAGAEKPRKLLLLGYFGFGNAGDELLCDTFIRRFASEFPDYEIAILNRGSSTRVTEGRLHLVPRSNLFLLAEELVNCRLIAIPGGGVLQSATSSLSLVYYLSLLTMARLFGAVVLLPAQGLGPFATSGFTAGILQNWLSCELSKAGFLSARDSESAAVGAALARRESIPVSSDLVFLNEKPRRVPVKRQKDALRVGAVIRSSVPDSARIVADLLRMRADNENLELVPVAFQPGEDETVWRSAGWIGDILYAADPLEAFAEFDVVVSMRLHGCIVSTCLSIPWIGIAYDPKVTAFAAACRWQFCCPPPEATQGYFEEKLNLLAGRRQEFSDKLHRIAGENRRSVDADITTMLARAAEEN